MPRLVSPRPLAAALAVVAALALGACGEDGDVSKAQFQADLVERTEVPEDVAACLTDRIFEDYDQAEVNRIYRAATEDELGNERRDELDTLNQECFEAQG
ncbi:hypothetical protein HC251_16490 [Iamia sp. SCSIO 61187]|uniref:hypothetical protein n=1 Tax=Iamia sp. SCSIO 61187 TaxID=2722752 RepID=UPI001C633A79|nr:hypothetical protein [Iamia sp. SCSIO 61187]QYG93870.1 hypothetical protein HC251_16490 [Iamia sp. SCSIO 61187]